MKIIRLIPLLDFGGIERNIENTSHWNDDNDWMFIAIGRGGATERRMRENGKNVHCLGLPHKIPNLKTIVALWRFFRREKPDVVHASGVEAYFHGMIAAWLAGVPIRVAEEIGIPKHSTITRIVIRHVLKLANYTGIGTAQLYDLFQKRYRVPEKKLRLLPNFIVETPLDARSDGTDKFRILTVSRLHPVKNIGSILRVLPALAEKYPNIIYTIVGEGPQQAELEELVGDLGITRHVEFAGYDPEPYHWLLGADLYLLTSWTEGCSISLLEAMYAATPSISTRVGAAEEIISDGVNGWLIDPGDDDALREKIETAINLSHSERRRIGLRGREKILDGYTLEKYMARLKELYKR